MLAVMAMGVATFCSGVAQAAPLTQPNGDPIPSTSALQAFLAAEGEPYATAADGVANVANIAQIEPQTFNPLCNLTFKVVGRGGGQLNSFGWYNVKVDGSNNPIKPTNDELVEFIKCGDAVGTVKTLDIKNDPRYAHGQIGFFEATTEGAAGNCVIFNAPPDGQSGGQGIADNSTLGYVYYSQYLFNPDLYQGDPSKPFIHVLNLPSEAYPSAFYFGWEDLNGTLSAFDNDFEDLLMRVSGLVCDGGGEACTVSGQQGLCAAGVTQCSGGQIVCEQKNQPSAEKCNNIDDDCDGQVDNGTGLCAGDPGGDICFQGTCVGSCSSGEFVCPTGLSCDDAAGVCVDPLCVGVTCDAGKVCHAGVCEAPCDGVVCPLGQECALGHCVDLCAGITCDEGYACTGGVCKVSCQCSGCDAGNTCVSTGTSAGLCIDDACAALTTPCGAGTVCQNGTCVDACQGAMCPDGQTCEQGQCVASSATGGAAGSSAGEAGAGIIGGSDAGGTAGSAAHAGSAGHSAGGASGAAASSTGGSTAGASAASTGGTASGAPAAEDDSGCGCRVVSSTSSAAGLRGVTGLFAMVAMLGRRRLRSTRKIGVRSRG